GGVRRFPLRGAQPSTPPREAHSTRSALEREFNPAEADCGLQGTANSPSSTAKPKTTGGGAGIRTRGTGVTRARHFQCRTFGRSVTPPRFWLIGTVDDLKKLAEGRGFEPPRDLLGPYPISSRTPSTGLGHPSANSTSSRVQEPAQQRRTLGLEHAAHRGHPMVQARVVQQPLQRLDRARFR